MVKETEFEDFVVMNDNFKVVWEHIGEGWSGEFDPAVSDDEPLLRFSCLRGTNDGWEEVENGSYCTRCPISTPRHVLLQFAKQILEALKQPSPKRRLQELSWLCPADYVN